MIEILTFILLSVMGDFEIPTYGGRPIITHDNEMWLENDENDSMDTIYYYDGDKIIEYIRK